MRFADLMLGPDSGTQLPGRPRSAMHDRYVIALARPIRARLASSPAPATYPPRGVPPKGKRPAREGGGFVTGIRQRCPAMSGTPPRAGLECLAAWLVVWSGAPLGGVVRLRSVSWRATVPCHIALAALPTLVTSKRHSYPPCFGAVLADLHGFVLMTGRHHLTPVQWAVAPLTSERATSRAHYNGSFAGTCGRGHTVTRPCATRDRMGRVGLAPDRLARVRAGNLVLAEPGDWGHTMAAAQSGAAQPNPGRPPSGAPRRHNPAPPR
jgi:hypothetical protein